MNYLRTLTIALLCVAATPLRAVTPSAASTEMTAVVPAGELAGMFPLMHSIARKTAITPAIALRLPPHFLLVSADRTDLRWDRVVPPAALSAPGSLLDQFPIVNSMRQRTGDRFNTAEGSHPNDLALCYRLSSHVGLQLIPGDPTPSSVKPKLGLAGNHAGVTMGLTLRLDRLR